MTEIKIKQFSHNNYELLETGPDAIKLGNNHLFYEHSCKAKVIDEKTDLKIEKYYRNKYVFIKNFISSIELWYANDSEIWCLSVECGGHGFDLKFESQKDAESVLNKIMNWRNDN